MRVTATLAVAICLTAEAAPKHAEITPFQRAVIERLVVAAKHLPAEASAQVADAAPHIKRFLAEMSCRFDYSKQAHSISVGPADKRTPYNDSGPMAELSSSHRYTVCLTVEEVHWVLVAEDVLGFEVVFRSDDSLETLRRRYAATKQRQGNWLFSYPTPQKQ